MSGMLLEVKNRTVIGKKVKNLIKQGFLPGVVYGHKIKNRNVAINAVNFEKVYKLAGESTLVDLKVEDEKAVKVIIQDVQLDSTGRKFIHADFHQVNMAEKINTEIELKFTGEAPAIKFGGVLIKNIDKISIACLPNDLVHEIEVDISFLDTLEKSIKVKDLKVGEGIEVLNDPEEIVARVEVPRAGEEKAEEKVEEASKEKVEEKTSEKG